MNSQILQNRNAVIYGGGGSLGSTIARAIAKEGAKVFLVWCPENNWADSSLPIVCRDSIYCVPGSKGTYGTLH